MINKNHIRPEFFEKVDDAYVRPDKEVKDMSAKELYELFGWYGFTDPIGHALILNTDFFELVLRATGEKPE